MPCPSMILDSPNPFGRVPIVYDGSNLFWSGPDHFGQTDPYYKNQSIKVQPVKV